MKNIIDTVLAKCRGKSESSEVIAYHGQSMPVEFRAGRLHSVEHKENIGIGLRVIKNGRIGFSSTTDRGKLDQLVSHALGSAEFGQTAAFRFPARCRTKPAAVYDPRLEKYGPEQAIAEGSKNLDILKKKAPQLKMDVTLNTSLASVFLANSQGLEVSYRKSTFSHYLSGMAVTQHGLLYVGDGRSGCRLVRDGSKMAGKIVRLYRNALKPAAVQTGRMPVIFSTDAAYLLWMALGLGVNGKQVQKKSSPLIGRIGQPVLDRRLTITDDPGYEYAAASAPCDDEGVCTARMKLFERGVLRGYVYDLQTAGLTGQQSTGHAQRHYNSLPAPSVSNLVIRPGTCRLSEMIRDIRSGIIVHDFLGAGQSNLLAGDFSANIALGYKIENGRLAGRVKDVMISGNIYQMLKEQLVDITDQQEPVVSRGSFITPAVMFKDVNIAAK
jgi:PmbA protein